MCMIEQFAEIYFAKLRKFSSEMSTIISKTRMASSRGGTIRKTHTTVLLRETARASLLAVTFPSITCPGWGYQILSWPGSTPSCPGWAYPRTGVSLPQTGTGVTLQKGHGTSHWGTPRKDMTHPWKGHGTNGSIMGWRWGTPLLQVVDKVKTLPSIIIWMWAVI